MTERLQSFVAGVGAEVEAALRSHLPLSPLPAAERLNDALRYALFPGGKRLRPVLSLLASALVGVPRAEALTVACAVEFLHGSSLIIDDLPCMDDADLRRNRRTLHLVYGEGTAMLAALALLNQSYALLARAARSCGRAGAAHALVSEAARAVGAEGMIGGQALDLELRAGCADADALAGRDLKTAALTRLMMTAGALARGAEEEDARALREFGECFGRAYQVCDDLLDGGRDAHLSGKTAGQDARHGRANAVEVLGARGARRTACELIERGVEALGARFGRRAEAQLLTDAARRVVERPPGERAPENFPPPAPARGETASAGD
ncbi:MAG TPA: polyprenyl synthetase family protein [Pyrinomonadaceae bacterium]|nr:polyprenyl synthetase family protein [Pyrinomonadaceae bacterium]